MYPNLLGQAKAHGMSNDRMASVINVSRTSYEQKLRSGRFTPQECKLLCKEFNKPFDFLFATESELPTLE